MYCPITGECHCKCGKDQEPISALQVDLTSTLRKLFTDHAVYTKFVINAIIDGTADIKALLPRLMQNQVDIGDQLKPIIGNKSSVLIKLLQKHIELAGATVTEIAQDSTYFDSDVVSDSIQEAINNQLWNGNQVASFLSALNSEVLGKEMVESMFQQHNMFVVMMAMKRKEKDYVQELVLYDAYYNQILEMSDAISNAL